MGSPNVISSLSVVSVDMAVTDILLSTSPPEDDDGILAPRKEFKMAADVATGQ